MIENGTLTHPFVNSTLQTWHPVNELLNAFLYAIFGTIIAFQLAAIIFDLLLGFKAPGQATASDVSVLLLTEESTLFKLLANLHFFSAISRWKFHRLCIPPRDKKPSIQATHSFPHYSDSSDSSRTRIDLTKAALPSCPCRQPPARPSPSILLKLFVLLLTAPVSNLLAVFLTVESGRLLTFNDVSFGGVTYGIPAKGKSFIPRPTLSDICAEYETTLSEYETAISTFHYCERVVLTPSEANDLHNTSSLRLSYGVNFEDADLPKEAVTLQYDEGTTLFKVSQYIDLLVEESKVSRRDSTVWRVKTSFPNLGQLEDVFRQRAAKFESDCRVEPFNPEDVLVEKDSNRWMFEKRLNCIQNPRIIRTELMSLFPDFALVPSDKLRVVGLQTDGGEEIDGKNFLFIRRRQSVMALGALGISVAVLLVLRVIVRVFTRNDVHLGVEMVLKDVLSLHIWDSMLQNERVVDYSERIYKEVKGFESQDLWPREKTAMKTAEDTQLSAVVRGN